MRLGKSAPELLRACAIFVRKLVNNLSLNVPKACVAIAALFWKLVVIVLCRSLSVSTDCPNGRRSVRLLMPYYE